MRIEIEDTDYRSAHVALVDALRAYIRSNEFVRRYMAVKGTLTPEFARAADEHIARCWSLLREIEEHHFDPSLHGLIK